MATVSIRRPAWCGVTSLAWALFVALVLVASGADLATARTLQLSDPLAAQASPPPNPRDDALERIAAQRREAQQQVGATAAALQAADTPGNRLAFEQALAGYRQVVAAELVIATVDMTPEDRQRHLAEAAAQAAAQYQKLREEATRYLLTRIEAGEGPAAHAVMEATLKTARAQMEITAEAARRERPLVQEPFTFQHVNATTERLKVLLEKIQGNYVEEPSRPSWRLGERPTNAERQVEQWLRQQDREADVAEYLRLARGGVVLGTDGRPITGVERTRIAANAEQQLVEALRAQAVGEGLIARLLGFEDTRTALARQREAELLASDEYRALEFMRPNIDGPALREVARALASVIRQEQTRIADWRAGRIPPGGQGGVTGWLYENFVAKQKVGLGRALEISGLSRDTLQDIDSRIELFNAEADLAVEALNAMATATDPSQLTRGQYMLLERYGYIVKDASGRDTFTIPGGIRMTQRLGANLNLPGSTWLDIISGENLIKTVTMVAAPQLAAGRAALLLEGWGVGAGGVTAGNLVINTLAGAALDAASQKIETGKVDYERLVIEAVFLGPLLQGQGALLGEGGSALAQMLRNQPQARQLAVRGLVETLGLTSEAALQAYWESRVKGEGITWEDFLANAVNGAISRGAVSALHGTARAREGIPSSFTELFRGNAAATAEVLGRAEAYQRKFDDAISRLIKITGMDPTTPEATARMIAALESGQYSWADLKMLYRDMPDRLMPLMRGVNERRLAIVADLVESARTRARQQIEAEYALRAARDGEAAAQAWRGRELELLAFEPIKPGSGDLTSDIDRSVRSAYMRNALRQVADETFNRAEGLPPTTARAYDVNNYIDVFPTVDRTRAIAGLNDVPVGAHRHGDLVEASSFAAAMMHMSPADARRFQETLMLQTPQPDRPALLEKFRLAHESLERGRRELQAEVDRLVTLGADRSSPDTVLRARDNLYGERTLRLNEMEFRLRQLDPNRPEYRQLAAEIHREWNYALREGIETYSDFTSLKIVVMEGQIKNRSIRELIDDKTFTATSSNVSDSNVRAFLNDQAMMITEHAHAYHHGHESTLDAAAAIGKYGERVVLGFKLGNVNLASGPHADLNKVTEAMVRARKDPKALEQVLTKFGSGDADRGLQRVMDLLERTVPGLEGMLTAPPPAGATGTSTGAATAGRPSTAWASLALQKERERELERIRAEAGSGAVVGLLGDELTSMESELRRLLAEKAEADRRRALYREQDGPLAIAAENEVKSLQQQIANLPNRQGASATAQALRAQLVAAEAKVRTFQLQRGTTASTPSEADARRDRRIAALQQQIPARQAALTEWEQRAAVDAARTAHHGLDAEAPGIGDIRKAVDRAANAPSAESQLGERDRRRLEDVRQQLAASDDPEDAALLRELDEKMAGWDIIRAHLTLAGAEEVLHLDDTRFDAVGDESPPRVTVPDAGYPPDLPTQILPPGSETQLHRTPPAGIRAPESAGLIPGAAPLWQSLPGFEFTLVPTRRGTIVDLVAQPSYLAVPAPTADAARDPTVQRMIMVLRLKVSNTAPPPAGRGGADRTRDRGPLRQAWGTMRSRFARPAVSASILHAINSAPPPPTLSAERVEAARERPSSVEQERRNADAPGLLGILTSLGTSTGEAFTIQVLNDGPEPIELSGEGLVVEPLTRAAQKEAQRQLARLAGRNPVTATVHGYCLEFLRQPPSAGTVFRIAAPEVQQRYASMRSVLQAAERLELAGRLRSDGGSIADYVHSIRQWALWAREQDFSLEGFQQAFIEHTRKNVMQAGQRWTSQLESAIEQFVPHRWEQIRMVLDAADGR